MFFPYVLEIRHIHLTTREGPEEFEVYALPHTNEAHCIQIVCYVFMRVMTYDIIFNCNRRSRCES